ncbi:MAG: hypothetical protein M0017_07760, partial [Desulfobacteraceae bacterium]|nr:hypothetical protein [Desulfobacteraceae bacterium]
MSKARILSFLTLGSLLAACAPMTGPPPAPALPAPKPGPVMPVGQIDQRLAAYTQKYNEWQAVAGRQTASGQEAAAPWAQCLRMAGSLRESYGRLREEATQVPAAAARPGQPPLDPWEVLRADIGYLESGCDPLYRQLKAEAVSAASEPTASVPEPEAAVVRLVGEHRYEDALAAYRSLEQRFPDRQPSLPARRAYGMALLYTGQVDKAAAVLGEVLPRLPEGGQPAAKRLSADLLLATYQLDKAKALYQSLSVQFAAMKEEEQWVADQLALLENPDSRADEMAAYIDILRLYLTFDG